MMKILCIFASHTFRLCECVCVCMSPKTFAINSLMAQWKNFIFTFFCPFRLLFSLSHSLHHTYLQIWGQEKINEDLNYVSTFWLTHKFAHRAHKKWWSSFRSIVLRSGSFLPLSSLSLSLHNTKVIYEKGKSWWCAEAECKKLSIFLNALPLPCSTSLLGVPFWRREKI